MNATYSHTKASRKTWRSRLANFFGLAAQSRSSTAAQRSRKANPSVEALEDRCLMAASLTASLNNGVLQIEGTDGPDYITVAQKDNRLTVSGLSVSYDVSQVKSISINALGSDDYVLLWTLSGQQPIMIPTTIDAGAGNDYVVGGEGANTIHGGDGNDVLQGNAGNDVIYGDAGSDTIYGCSPFATNTFGRSDANVLQGGDGNDSIYGSAGIDVIFGQAGDDVLDGGAGNDRIDGGAGNDQLTGGYGNDLLFGADGNDTLSGGYGEDILHGGGGVDVLSGGDGTDFLFFDAYDWYLGKVDGGTGYTYLYYNGTTTQLQQALQQRNGDLGLTSTAPAFNNGLPTNYWAQETVINDDGTWVQYWAQPVDNLLVSNPGYNF